MEKALVIDKVDNVATATSHLKSGEVVSLSVGSKRLEVHLNDDIPFGHKFAIRHIDKGDDVLKYGERIGRSLSVINVGNHVHIHNIERVGE